MIARRTLVVVASLVALLPAKAQLLSQTALDSAKEYHSIESAMKEPDKVYKLQLSRKKLKEVPEEIRRFTNLNELDLGGNRLRDLPAWMSELVHMQEFHAPKNKFTTVPKVICEWKELKRLDLHQNEITGLPACMGGLAHLFSLDMWSNDLEDFPEELEGLKELKFLDLRVIQFDDGEMDRISALFPRTRIFFSQPCNCGSTP